MNEYMANEWTIHSCFSVFSYIYGKMHIRLRHWRYIVGSRNTIQPLEPYTIWNQDTVYSSHNEGQNHVGGEEVNQAAFIFTHS